MISLVSLQIEKLDARQGPGLPSGDLAWTAVAAPGLRLPHHSSSVPGKLVFQWRLSCFWSSPFLMHSFRLPSK